MNIQGSKSEVLAFLGEYLYVHNYWASIRVQNYYAHTFSHLTFLFSSV